VCEATESLEKESVMRYKNSFKKKCL